MIPNFLITVLVPFLFGVMAVFFLVIGLRGIVFKKPFVISSRWFLILILLGFYPAMLPSILLRGLGDNRGHLTIVQWLSPAILIVVGIFLYFTLRGYIAFGITDVSFREGLLASLGKLNLPHEEKLAAVRLPTIGADIQVAVQSWIGTGQLKMKQPQFSTLLTDIVGLMNEYYRGDTVSKTNLTCCILYVVIGVLMAVCAGGFLLAFGKLF